MIEEIKINNKEIRSNIIKDYLDRLNKDKVICLSCGNASRELKKTGLKVETLGSDKGELNKKLELWEIQNRLEAFDATSGHLNFWFIEKIANEIRKRIPNRIFTDKLNIYVPTGSGETLIALSYLFNIHRLKPIVSRTYKPIMMDYTPIKELILKQYEVTEINDINSIKEIKDRLKGEGYLIQTEN